MKANSSFRTVRGFCFAAIMGLVFFVPLAQGQVTCTFTNIHPTPFTGIVQLQGTYFNNTTLSGSPVFTRNDPNIDFNWGLGSPDPRISLDNFSVGWTGYVAAPYSGTYTFYATSDDGIRVWFNGQLIIDAWHDQAATEYASAPINLVANTLYDFQINYYEHTGDAVAEFAWSGPNIPGAIVGGSYFPDPTGDKFGQTLASIGGGQYFVGTPLYDLLISGTLFPDDGNGWSGDASGALSQVGSWPGRNIGPIIGRTAAFFERGFGASAGVTGNGQSLISANRYYGGSATAGWITNMGAVFVSGALVGNPSGLAQTYFGTTVAGLAGAQWAASSTEGSGKVYVMSNSAVTAVITNPSPASPPYFAFAMAGMSTNRLLISNPYDSVAGDQAGSVFVYDYSGHLLQKIHNVGGRSTDAFGAALAVVDDHRFFIGAPNVWQAYDSGGGVIVTNTAAGAVYLYNDQGIHLLTLTNPSNPSVCASAQFGNALSMLGPGRVLVGAPGETDNSYNNAGAVHLFNVDGLNLENIQSPNAAVGEGFGSSLCALDERHFVIGAPNNSTLAYQAGAIYGYDDPIPSADLGAAIPPPPPPLVVDGTGTFQTQGPSVSPAGAALWHAGSQQLLAVKPGGILVSWPLQGGGTYNWQASISWPTNNALYQVHIAGQTPVDLSSGGMFSNAVLEATTTGADASTVSATRIFSAQNPGTSFLMLSSGDPSSNAIRFQFVRTIVWNDPAYLYDNAPATIGQPIVDPAGFHDPAAGSPQVVVATAVYCPAPVFDPATRTGTIIPVNQLDPSSPAHDLGVAFYQRGKVLYDPVTGLTVSNNIFWPYQPVRFQPQWPTNAPTIVIASGQGTGVINPTVYKNWQLYYQNDPSQAGFNPNDEHAIRLPSNDGTGEAVFPIRSDLGTPQTSEPYVLIRYQDPVTQQWLIKVWQVVAEQAPFFFNYPAEAGLQLSPPMPLSALLAVPESIGVSGPYWEDRKLSFWAKAAGDDGGHSNIVMHYFYPMQNAFFYPGSNPPPAGSSIPFLDLAAGTPGTPIDVTFDTSWPANVAELRVGETLVTPKNGLPDISSQTSVQVLYQQAEALGQGTSVKLIDPTREYDVPLLQLPSDLATRVEGVNYFFTDLPIDLQYRLYWDKTAQLLRFKGQFTQPSLGEYYLELNVLTSRDLNTILGLSSDLSFQNAVNQLYTQTANVTEVPPDAHGFDSMALTAGAAQAQGYVTLAFGNNSNLSPPDEPVSLAVIKVSCPSYRGEIEVIPSGDPFDEKITLRHSGDFAGKADSYIFDWRTLPSVSPGLTNSPDQWPAYPLSPGSGQGAVDITIKGAGLFTLSDNAFTCRYRPVSAPLCASPTNALGWSDWTPLNVAPGWISRVLGGINPFDQRKTNYANTSVNTIVSMISQAGKPYDGPVALNEQNANNFGLIETYETVLRRGESLSISAAGGGVNYQPANDELLKVAGQLADLYMLLGNEAYADAEDPTIAIGTDNQVYGAEATSIHCFQGQTASLMEEELDLLRGRDDSVTSVQIKPVYNRLFWNFTQGVDAGGELAYALNYNIRPQSGNVSGTISQADAAVLYPQGHGDAWGHYLSAIKNYYRLLRNPNFTWVPTVGYLGTVAVGYDHERKFAAAAAARARTGAEIVNLTYRNAYVEDPAGQWQGYADSKTNRAWGVSEWGSRAGQGAFFDWVAANALLPDVDPDSSHTGIQKVDRTTVTEIRDIASALGDIQTKVDQADSGLNPLGLAKNAVPFDIDPNLIASGQTHFEQIYNRAIAVLSNATNVFNRANNCTQLLRQQSDDVANFQSKVADQEADFNSRLIEIFGYPYAEDIGPTGAYPSGYNGPDIYHFDYVDQSAITGEIDPPTQTLVVTITELNIDANGGLTSTSHPVAYNISSEALGLAKPSGWTSRQAPGQIQMARSDFLQAYARFQKASTDYNNLVSQIEDRANLLRIQFSVAATDISILYENTLTQEHLNDVISQAKQKELSLADDAKHLSLAADALADALPKVAGLATDWSGPIRGAIKVAALAKIQDIDSQIEDTNATEVAAQQAKEIASLQEQIELTADKNQVDLTADLQQLQELVRQEASARLELFAQAEAMQQMVGRYDDALAGGERLLEDRLRFRQQTAAQVQQYRYKDMAFRIFRNDALQKYRAQFDLAAMYVYLAARAYDYETDFQENDPVNHPGAEFMTSIIGSQALGIIQNGNPQLAPTSGDGGLADPLAKLIGNWQVLKSQLGFNNPLNEITPFSLRYELFRIQKSSAGSKTWQAALSRCVVPNLLDLPEYKRFCNALPNSLPVEPAIVIPFATSINLGYNLFGWPSAPGDHTYPSTYFATKIRSVGVWFANYNNAALVSTPIVYLIPVGEDVMRSPSSADIRSWRILDQKLPAPNSLGSATLNNPGWFPESPGTELQGTIGDLLTYAELPAYTDAGGFSASQVTSSSRLIGRSVWNTRWLLIIPAAELLSDRNEAIQRFINGTLLPDGTRAGNGVTDIEIYFQTYAYSGN